MSELKPCSICKEEKPQSEFGVKSKMCKPCRKTYDKARPHREGNNPRNNSTESARARKRRYVKKNLHPEKTAARVAVKNAILSGLIERKTSCETCGDSPKRVDGVTAVQAHHDDYSKPLDVRFLCTKCHTEWHMKNDAARQAKEKNDEQ